MKFMKLNIQLFASGTIEFPASGYLQGKIEWSSSGDVSTQKSLVTSSLYARRTNSYITTGKSWSGNVNIGGNNHIFNSMLVSTSVSSSWVKMQTYSDTITHDSDGTKTITISGSIKGPSGTALANNTSSGSDSAVLDTLHKSPTISITSITELNTNLSGIANNVIVQNLSKKKFEFSTVLDNATIQGITLSNGTTTATGTSSPITIDFNNKSLYTTANSAPIKALIVDSPYGLFGEDTKYYSYIPYTKPSIISTSTTVKRNGQLSGRALLNLVGTFYNQTIGSVANSITIQYKFWEKDTTEPSSWNDINNPTISHNNITVSNYEIGSNDTSASNYFNPQKAYNVRIKITDAMRDSDGVYKSDSVLKTIPLGEDVWAEYKDRLKIKKIQNPQGIYSLGTGNVNTPVGNGNLIIKKASQSGDSSPNNGVVLEFGNSTNWTGQLYIGDNATQGIYYNGWSNGTRGNWRRLADIPRTLYNNDTGIQSKSYASVSGLADYKKLAITFTAYKNSDQANTGGTAHICWLDLSKKDANGYARAGIVVPYSDSHLSSGNIQPNDFKALFEADVNNNRVYCLFGYNGSVQTSSGYVMTKIEGYYN